MDAAPAKLQGTMPLSDGHMDDLLQSDEVNLSASSKRKQNMSPRKKPAAKPDDLIASKIKGGEIELTEDELGHVSGGAASDQFLTLDGIKGESQDDKHKDTIEISSFKK
jgi:hypothetical protein